MTSIAKVYQTAVSEEREANHVMHCVASQNGASLWVGNLAAADWSMLRTYNISYVVNCTA